MKEFVTKLFDRDAVGAKSILDEKIKNLVDEKLNQIKIRLAVEIYEEVGVEVDFVTEETSAVTKMGRTKLIRVRIRKGKIQRRKTLSATKGYTIRGGHLTRMSPLEHRHRMVSAKRAKFKRLVKMQQIVRNRSRSLRKRHNLGL
jgi:hypothetical protein